jgi:large subunit ribosomal protein L7Ae
VIQY